MTRLFPARLFCVVCLFVLIATLWLAQTSPVAAAPPAVAAPDTPAVAVVREFVADRTAGKTEAAYALLSSDSQKGLPLSGAQVLLQRVMNPVYHVSARLVPIVALIVDFHDTLHFKFRVIGASEDDPTVVLVQAYQAGTPLSTIQTLKIATIADPAAGGAPRINFQRTVFFINPPASRNAKEAASQSNLDQISLVILQYAHNHNGAMPDAANWMDEIMPYLHSDAVFHDPSAPDNQKWSYAYNSALSHRSLSQLAAHADTVMVFESTQGIKNASDTGTSVPIPGRHEGGTDYALADGHVQWFKDGTKLSYRLDGK